MTSVISTAKGFTYCPNGAAWFKRHGAFDSSSRSGDVVFFAATKFTRLAKRVSKKNCSDAWPVGIVDQVLDADTIISIEGNMNAGVMRQLRMSDVWDDFGRPAYNSQQFVSAIPAAPERAIQLCQPPLANQAIACWKHQMSQRGWNFSGPEEVFDDKAAQVLQKFQREKHLAVDGQLGPMSWRAAWEVPVVAGSAGIHGPLRQARLIGTDPISDHVRTLDDANGLRRRSSRTECCGDAQLRRAGFEPLSNRPARGQLRQRRHPRGGSFQPTALVSGAVGAGAWWA